MNYKVCPDKDCRAKNIDGRHVRMAHPKLWKQIRSGQSVEEKAEITVNTANVKANGSPGTSKASDLPHPGAEVDQTIKWNEIDHVRAAIAKLKQARKEQDAQMAELVQVQKDAQERAGKLEETMRENERRLGVFEQALKAIQQPDQPHEVSRAEAERAACRC